MNQKNIPFTVKNIRETIPQNITVENVADNIKTFIDIPILYTNSKTSHFYVTFNKAKHVPEIIISRYDNNNPQLQVYSMIQGLGQILASTRLTYKNNKWHLRRPKHGTKPTLIISANMTDGYLNHQPKDILTVYGHGTWLKHRQQAEKFADQVLMPISKLKHIIKQSHNKNIDALQYDVSVACYVPHTIAWIRLAKLQHKGINLK